MNQKRAASIVDVAKGAGVSPATVSRYLNKPDVVGNATKDRIESAIASLGYVRNRMAGSLHGQRTGAVGLVVPTIDNAIFSEMIEAFSTRLLDHDYTMLIASHGYSLDLEARLVRSLLERRVDAIGVIGFDHADDAFAPLAERGIPLLTLWNYDADAAGPCIGVDNEQAGWVVARYLIDLGHRDIGLLFGETANNDRARDGGTVRAGLSPVPASVQIRRGTRNVITTSETPSRSSRNGFRAKTGRRQLSRATTLLPRAPYMPRSLSTAQSPGTSRSSASATSGHLRISSRP